MKKSLSLVLAMVMVLAFAGCGKTEQVPTTPIQTVTPVNVEFPKLDAGATIPEGCTYTTATGETLKAGSAMPVETTKGDTFTTKEFVYSTYEYFNPENTQPIMGWNIMINTENVDATAWEKAEDPIYEQINGLNLLGMNGTFKSCVAMKETPAIPNTVMSMAGTFLKCLSLETVNNFPENIKDMAGTFVGCEKLKNVPAVPAGVFTMPSTFQNCTSLEKTPDFSNCKELKVIDNAFNGCFALKETCTIPEGVSFMNNTFNGCSLLSGEIKVNANNLLPNNCKDAFKGCGDITLTGTASEETMTELASSASVEIN